MYGGRTRGGGTGGEGVGEGVQEGGGREGGGGGYGGGGRLRADYRGLGSLGHEPRILSTYTPP